QAARPAGECSQIGSGEGAPFLVDTEGAQQGNELRGGLGRFGCRTRPADNPRAGKQAGGSPADFRAANGHEPFAIAARIIPAYRTGVKVTVEWLERVNRPGGPVVWRTADSRRRVQRECHVERRGFRI